MKTFLNVLYRRILYKIPLKWLLISIAVFGLMFACTKADLVLSQSDTVSIGHDSYTYSFNNYDMFCIKAKNCDDRKVWFFPDLNAGGGGYTNFNTTQGQALGVCAVKTDFLVINDGSTCDIIIDKYLFEDYTSSQCQTEYNLIPISEVDSSYCQSNNLCPSGGTPGDCPNVGVSNIWINDIFHPGAFNVIMNIPQEIDWDYAYTNSGQNLNIDVVGYNVDYDYIDDITYIQGYKPTSEDFTNLISNALPLFVPGLVIILFLYFIFKFIKKIF